MAERLIRAHLRKLMAESTLLAMRGQLTETIALELSHARRALATITGDTSWDA